MSASDERLVGIGEVAAYLGVSTGTVRRLRQEGRFAPAYRIGRHVRWRMSDVDAWLRPRKEKVA